MESFSKNLSSNVENIRSLKQFTRIYCVNLILLDFFALDSLENLQTFVFFRFFLYLIVYLYCHLDDFFYRLVGKPTGGARVKIPYVFSLIKFSEFLIKDRKNLKNTKVCKYSKESNAKGPIHFG